jgi:tetratricopeptide (TPR) repeat protein
VKALREGQRALAAGDLPRAMQRLQQAVTLLPTNALAWNEYGVACHRAGQLTNAAMAYLRALQWNPDLLEARYNLGCVYLELGQFEPARSAFLACTLRDPGRVEAWWRLGLVCLQLRQTAEAERAFREMQRWAPNDPRPYNGLGLCALQRNRPQEAIRAFTAALQVRSNDPPARLNLAVTLHRYAGNLPAALEQYRQYLALQPTPPRYAEVLEVAHALEQASMAREEATARPAVTNVAQSEAATRPAEPGPGPTAPAAGSSGGVPRPAEAPVRTPSTPTAVARGPATGELETGSGRTPGRTEAAKPGPVTTGTAPALREPEIGGAREPGPTRPGPTRVQPVPTEVVRLPEPTPVVPAPGPGPAEARPTGAPPEPAARPEVEVVEPAQPLARTAPTGSRTPWWDRMNPVRWFGGREESVRRPTPLPGSAPAGEAAPAAGPAVAGAGSAPRGRVETGPTGRVQAPAPAPATASRTEEPPPDVPRYTYLRPGRPEPGDVNTANAWFARGLEAQRDGRLMDALQAYQMALEANPAFFEAYYNFALAAMKAGRLRDALRASEHALALRPESRDARYNFALALRQSGYLLDAASELETLLRRYPDDTRALLALGNLYAQQLRQPDRARVYYQRLLALEPGHPDAEAIRYWLSRHTD